ncbi:MAG TPA: potassium transporter Kup [Trebonia sp.]|jgi:KUP system potassium uptake protein|nr:potassium transporter Kup [Trebonia sp.]
MKRGSGQAALALGALGVVFGDIGTSPLYTVQTVFSPSDPHPVAINDQNVYGVTSLIFWSVMVVVTITYVLFVMRADNDGEGGIMALITLVRRIGLENGRRIPFALALLGVFGASLFFGDSMITPAISVLSAISGIEVSAPGVTHLVVFITAAVIVLLFLLQRLGTGAVGRLFGPVMCVWFTVIGLTGVHGIVQDPGIFRALSPTYAGSFLFGHFGTSFFAMSAVVLAVTGAEALYADMGHFGRAPVTRAWLLIVLPALVLNYFGQGALIVKQPDAISNPFFLLVPSWGQVPMVILAAVATVIASQAVIAGAYSVAQQAAQLGYLPRLRIDHTSEERIGQIYVPWINWALLVAVLALVFTFKTSNALAYAYGIAVTGTITITTLLFWYVARNRWGWPRWGVFAGATILMAVDLLFFTANLIKVLHGGWLPLLVGVLVFIVLVTWQKGRAIVTRKRRADEGSLRDFVDKLHAMDLAKVPGTAIFLNRGKETAPLAMRANVEHNHVLHEHVLIISIETKPIPHVAAESRLEVDDLGWTDDQIVHVTARFGYMDPPNVPSLLPLIRATTHCAGIDLDDLSYFLSTIELRSRPGGSELRPWRKRLFIATSRLTADAAEYFQLPRDRTVIMGSRIEI